MDAPRFDRFVRALAAGRNSRRGFALRAVAGLAGVPGLRRVQSAEAKDKGNGKGDGGGNDPACRGEGHPCEGNQTCCEGLECATSGPGAARRCTRPASGPCADCGPVRAAAAYAVEVDCAYDEGADETTCACRAAAPTGAPAVRALAVSTAEVCAEVVGGDARLASPGAAAAAGFASGSDGGILTLVLSGRVEARGSTTWWCTTDAGTVPATGPGLVRAEAAVSDSTGAVEVRAFACAEAASAEGFDWFGRCAEPKSGARFTLAATGDAAATKEGTAGPDGRCLFGGLIPGGYALTQVGAGWCHAESDGVDAKGNVVVEAGRRVAVWVFDCAAAK